MAETKSKFSGIFDNLATVEPESVQPIKRTEKPRAVAPPTAARPMGRPPGKRSDPAWKQYSVLLRIATQHEVTRSLRDKNTGQDLSELVEKLLEEWLKKQKP